jgi:hypothetical protein
MRNRPRAWTLLVASGLLLAACGGDGGDGGTQATAPPQPAKVTVTASASGKQVKFDMPAQVRPGATELTLVNNLKEPAELQLVQLDEGHKLAEFYPIIEAEEVGPIPPWFHAYGGVGETAPGERRSVVVDLKPGTYQFFSGGSPEQEGAEPQYKRGGEGSFEVTGDPTGAQLPSTPGQITAKEVSPTNYQFEVTGLKAGTNQVTFTNGGGELHHALLFRLSEGATMDQLIKFFSTENPQGPPPIDEAGSSSTTVLDTGNKQVETFELESGTYALACFISDRAGSPPHAIKAKMVKEVKVA